MSSARPASDRTWPLQKGQDSQCTGHLQRTSVRCLGDCQLRVPWAAVIPKIGRREADVLYEVLQTQIPDLPSDVSAHHITIGISNAYSSSSEASPLPAVPLVVVLADEGDCEQSVSLPSALTSGLQARLDISGCEPAAVWESGEDMAWAGFKL